MQYEEGLVSGRADLSLAISGCKNFGSVDSWFKSRCPLYFEMDESIKVVSMNQNLQQYLCFNIQWISTSSIYF